MSGVPRGDWAALKPCGTSAAYRRHLRHGERPCDSCKAAQARDFHDNRAAAVYAARNARYAALRAQGKTSREANRLSRRKEIAA